VYGSLFSGNTAASGNGNDIYRTSGTITVHDTCSSPYSTILATQGNALNTYGTVSGSAYSYSGSTCDHWLVDTMTGLHGKVSNYAGDGYSTGGAIMFNGDTAVLSAGSYACSEGTCAHTDNMLVPNDLSGSFECTNDSADCVIDGQSSRRGLYIYGTSGQTLTLRALNFFDGQAAQGGGIYIDRGALVEIVLVVFSNCKATYSASGGAAVYVTYYGTTVNVYGSRFAGNAAASGNGGDIFNYNNEATVTIHSTCPSPYNTNDITTGETLSTQGTVYGNPNTYYCYTVCPAGYYNPTLGDTISSCSVCAASDKSSAIGSTACLVKNWQVTNMNEFFNKVSETGGSKMANGETITLAANTYRCSDGPCEADHSMVVTADLSGSISCIEKSAACILGGESSRRGIYVKVRIDECWSTRGGEDG